MILFAYEDVGSGLCMLFSLVALAVGWLAWMIFWSFRGFRTSPPRSRMARLLWTFAGVSLLILMATFVPMRRVGEWRDQSTGAILAPGDSAVFDRWYFGYVPTYRWIGSLGSIYNCGAIVTLDGNGPNKLHSAVWRLDWFAFGIELVAALSLVLPFWRSHAITAEKRKEPAP